MKTLANRASAIAEQARRRQQQTLDQSDHTPDNTPDAKAEAATVPPIRCAWWRVHHWAGWPSQSVFTDPPSTYADMRRLYPDAAGIIPEDARS